MLHEPGHHRFFAHPFQFIVPRTLIIQSQHLQCQNCSIQSQITYKHNLHKLGPVCSWVFLRVPHSFRHLEISGAFAKTVFFPYWLVSALSSDLTMV